MSSAKRKKEEGEGERTNRGWKGRRRRENIWFWFPPLFFVSLVPSSPPICRRKRCKKQNICKTFSRELQSGTKTRRKGFAGKVFLVQYENSPKTSVCNCQKLPRSRCNNLLTWSSKFRKSTPNRNSLKTVWGGLGSRIIQEREVSRKKEEAPLLKFLFFFSWGPS